MFGLSPTRGPPMRSRFRVLTSCALAAATVWACTIYRSPEAFAVPKPLPDQALRVSTPVRAHLLDGQTVMFPDGFAVRGDAIATLTFGSAHRYSLTLADLGPVDAVPLDSILGLESVRDNVNVATSTLLTLAGVALVATPIIACATDPKCFGSCPTIYSDSAGTAVLEAEGFSYSIAPIFEAPDLDRLRARPDAKGVFRLEVRDEAYETHYINHLGLVEVRHDPGEVALPDNGNQPVAVRDFQAPVRARDRMGRDIRRAIADADGQVYRTPDEVLAKADSADPNDDIDLTFGRPAGTDTVAIVFRMRNSLLNTVLLYELMLGDPGLKSLDWVGHDLAQIGPAVGLGRWYAKHMGMRVLVRDGSAYRDVARITDTGPVAWKDVAVRVPALEHDSVRIRLSFVADDWRIDQVRLAARVRTPESRAIAPVELAADGHSDTAALARLRSPDDRYVVTTPGQRFFLSFATGPDPRLGTRTFLLASQGYYIEWLRGGWIRTERLASTFTPTDEALIATLRRWRAEQHDLELRFAATRVPVR